MRKEVIDIVPDITLFAKLGNANYSVSEAIAELIDNSIDAREEKVSINISIDKKSIVINDNAEGMDKQTAIDSIVLGKSSKGKGDLGSFGMGMKTACMSLGEEFEITTTQKGLGEEYSIKFGAEEFEKRGEWKHHLSISEDVSSEKSGTQVVITGLRFNHYPNLVSKVEEHLSERFGVFIEHGEAEIKINGNKLSYSVPELVEDAKKEFVIELSNGEKIKGWTGLLMKGSQEKSGFNLYRYNRLIRAHEKLGYQYHPSKMWITGEVHLDPVPVTHNKREFISNDPLFAEFFEKFKDILTEVIGQSQNRHIDEKVRDLPQHIKETLKDNFVKALNNFDDIKELAFPGSEQLKRSPDGVEQEKEKRDVAGDVEPRDEPVHTHKQVGRTPRKTSEVKEKFVVIAGSKYNFDYEWANLDNEYLAKEAFLDKPTGRITVYLNTKYKLLNVVKPDLLYMIFYLAEGIIEVFLRENGQSADKLVSYRDGIIKKLADIYADDLSIKLEEKDKAEVEAYSYLTTAKTKEEENPILSDREKNVLEMRLEKGMTLEEIGKALKVTRERARQIIARSLQKITAPILPKLTKEEIALGVQAKTDLKAQADADVNSQISMVLEKTASAYGIEMDDLLSRTRRADIAVARQFAMHSLRVAGLSFPRIGKAFDRDHTTVIHAFNKVEKLLAEA